MPYTLYKKDKKASYCIHKSTMQAQKWELSATSAKLTGVKPSQAWSLFGNFYDIHKYIPSIVVSSRKVDEGLRHLTVSMPIGAPPAHFVKDRLVKMDHAGRSYTFEVVENNLGFGKTVCTVKVVPMGADGCAIVWSATVEAGPGWTKSDLDNYMNTAAAESAKKIGEAVRGTK